MKKFPTPLQGTKRPYDTRVLTWMNRAALSLLLSRHKDGQPRPSAEMLADYLYEVTTKGGGRFVVSRYEDGGLQVGENRVTVEWVERSSLDAAEWALIHFDPDAYLERCARGGRNSKRGPSHTPEEMAAVAHLSISKAAAALRVSERTISNYRRRLRDQAVATAHEPTSAELDELLAAPSHRSRDQAVASAHEPTSAELDALLAAAIDAEIAVTRTSAAGRP